MGLISRWVNLQGIWYPSESISKGSDIPVSQSTRGLISQWVNLQGVWYAGESTSKGAYIPVSQSPRGHKSQWVHLQGVWYPSESISTSDILLSQSPQGLKPHRVNLHRVTYPGESSQRGIKPRGAIYLEQKIRITYQIFIKNRKYFYPLVNGSGRFELWKNWR